MSLNDIIGRLALVRQRFDPIPFCDLFKRQGFASWAEERSPYEWYIYFYRPGVRASADVRTPLSPSAFFRAAVAGH